MNQGFLTSDGVEIFEQYWQPSGQPRAAVAIIHGYGEHSGRYAHVVTYLVDHGFAVAALDLRGHGRSAGRRGDTPMFDAYVQDVEQFLGCVRQRYAELPLFVLAHSMGGTILIAYIIKHQPELAGSILCGALLKAPSLPVGLRRVMAILAKWLPRLPTIKLPSDHISRDPVVVQAYRDDPLVYHGRMPARVADGLLAACEWIGQHMIQVRLPLLIMHGTADVLADPDGSRNLATQARTSDTTLHLWDDLYHELLNEPEKAEVMALIVDWCEVRLGG